MLSKKKNPIFVRGWDQMITICHLSASLVTLIGYPQAGFFHLTLTLMIHSYITSLHQNNFIFAAENITLNCEILSSFVLQLSRKTRTLN